MAARNTLNAGLSALALAILLGVAGCGSDDESGGGGSSSATPPPDGSATVAPVAVPPNMVFESTVTGSVGDGPITGARMRVRASNGKVLMETESSLTADYDLTIKTQGRNYALTIEAEGGTDIVTQMAPDFRLVATLVKPNKRSVGNLNPFTTLIVGAAKSNGGINETTVAVARDAVVDRYGFGLDKNIIPDPTATPIDENTVHVIVKSSETLGEMIRRTRDALYASGGSLDGDGIMAALAADLSDGWIDGKGAAGHDPRVAAVANIASAAVLVQSMANRLHVYGYDATGAMDAAIEQIRPLAPATSSTAHVAIPAETLEQAVRTLEAARVLSDDLRLVKLIEVVRSASPGVLPADLAAGLAAETDPLLEELTITAAYASDDQLARINNVASGGTDTPPETTEPPPAEEPPPEEEPAPPPEEEPAPPPPEEPAPPPPEEPAPPPPNNPPVISGTPTASVLVGESWEFQPTASDPDGDSLSFSISNKPVWLNFDPATGRLSGTPADADVGIHSFITITVSDGQASVSLEPFSVTVSAPPPPPPPNNPPTISGSPDTALVVGNPWSFTPTASDADGDSLTFSISGRPGWLNFNSATGQLSGTPSSTDVGVHQDIVISVSDGQSTADLAPFSLTVTEPQPSTGSATLSWSPPTERVDGSAIGTISRYSIYYSRNSTLLDQVVNVSSSTNTYHIENLEQGTWYFAVTATDSEGLESAKSSTVSKTIP
jgi:hypothetical protein